MTLFHPACFVVAWRGIRSLQEEYIREQDEAGMVVKATFLNLAPQIIIFVLDINRLAPSPPLRVLFVLTIPFLG